MRSAGTQNLRIVSIWTPQGRRVARSDDSIFHHPAARCPSAGSGSPGGGAWWVWSGFEVAGQTDTEVHTQLSSGGRHIDPESWNRKACGSASGDSSLRETEATSGLARTSVQPRRYGCDDGPVQADQPRKKSSLPADSGSHKTGCNTSDTVDVELHMGQHELLCLIGVSA